MASRLWPEWATKEIADLGDGTNSKVNPGATKQADGWSIEKPPVQYMNWWMNLVGIFLKALGRVQVVATNYKLSACERVIVNNITAIANVELPQTPLDGQWVEVGGQGLYSKFPVFVKGVTKDIMLVGDKTCELDAKANGAVFRFWWNQSLSMWRAGIISQEGKS